jgi:hypothetical protein
MREFTGRFVQGACAASIPRRAARRPVLVFSPNERACRDRPGDQVFLPPAAATWGYKGRRRSRRRSGTLASSPLPAQVAAEEDSPRRRSLLPAPLLTGLPLAARPFFSRTTPLSVAGNFRFDL